MRILFCVCCPSCPSAQVPIGRVDETQREVPCTSSAPTLTIHQYHTRATTAPIILPPSRSRTQLSWLLQTFPRFSYFLDSPTPPSLYTYVSYRSDNAGCAWQHRAGGHKLLDRPALFINHVKWSYTGKSSIAHLDRAQIHGGGQRLICLLHYLISVIDML